MDDAIVAKYILDEILDEYGQMCVTTEYAKQLIMKALAEARGDKFEITVSSI